jgi:hypothetical protein
VIQFLIKKIFPGTKTVVENGVKCLLVEEVVLVTPHDGYLELEWEASPMPDSIADTVALTALQVKSAPSPALLQSMAQSDIEDQNFAMVVRIFNERFDTVNADMDNKQLEVTKNGCQIMVDYEKGTVTSEDEILQAAVQDLLNTILPI